MEMERKVRYVQDGNTVRKVYEFPERKTEERRKVKEAPRRQTHRHVEDKSKMSLKMTLLLAVSVMVSVICCISYLNVQAEMTEVKNSIVSLEKSITTLAAQNDSVEYEIDSYVDVDYIIKTAKEELGMVMADESQIVTYESTKNEYMEQYGDVPELK